MIPAGAWGTGGTVDKLESIPGYSTTPEPADFDRIVRQVGCAVIGQTADLAAGRQTLLRITRRDRHGRACRSSPPASL